MRPRFCDRPPGNHVLLVGALTLLALFLLNYERGAELLTFGAFLAFVGVNLTALGTLPPPLTREGTLAGGNPACRPAGQRFYLGGRSRHLMDGAGLTIPAGQGNVCIGTRTE